MSRLFLVFIVLLILVSCGTTSHVIQEKIVNPETCNHIGTVTKVIKSSNCGKSGLKEISCAYCGTLLRTEEIPPIGMHNYESPVVLLEPTCTAKGYYTRKCSLCDRVFEFESNPLGHYWGSFKQEKMYPEITYSRTCLDCGIKEELPLNEYRERVKTLAELVSTLQRTNPQTPEWFVDFFVDEWGDITNRKYAFNQTKGQFSNTATTGDIAYLGSMLTEDYFGFAILEYEYAQSPVTFSTYNDVEVYILASSLVIIHPHQNSPAHVLQRGIKLLSLLCAFSFQKTFHLVCILSENGSEATRNGGSL
ncbi:MAG: hypothetical protein KBS81_01960 [Spirochaetales bacterium]|nr:hypothetical protein [Candidatus Physcosoma equi]